MPGQIRRHDAHIEICMKEMIQTGKRLLNSITEKMASKGISGCDLTVQQKNGWRLKRKNCYDIFIKVHSEDL